MLYVQTHRCFRDLIFASLIRPPMRYLLLPTLTLPLIIILRASDSLWALRADTVCLVFRLCGTVEGSDVLRTGNELCNARLQRQRGPQNPGRTACLLACFGLLCCGGLRLTYTDVVLDFGIVSGRVGGLVLKVQVRRHLRACTFLSIANVTSKRPSQVLLTLLMYQGSQTRE